MRFQGTAVDVQAPVIVTGGANISVKSHSYDSYGGTIALTNSGATVQTVSEMTIDGKLLESGGEMVAQAQDDLSIAQYGEEAYSLDNPYIQRGEHTQALANDLLEAYNVLGTELAVRMTARGLPHLQLGDLVTVNCTPAHVAAEGWVVRSRLALDNSSDGELTILTEGQAVVDYGHGFVTGVVQLEGRTNYSGVTVHTTGEINPAITATDGSFTLAVQVGTGVVVMASMLGYLSAQKTGATVTFNQTTSIGTTQPLGGDANEDEVIDSTDYLIVLSYQGAAATGKVPWGGRGWGRDSG